MTQDEVKTIHTNVDKVLKQRKGIAPTDSQLPILEGDLLTFSVPKSGDVSELVVFHPTTTTRNGREIKEHFSVILSDGREVTQKQLVGNRGNGLLIEGDSPDERLKNFLALVAEHKSVEIKVDKIRILPSTRPDWNGIRIFTWNMAV